MKDRHHFPRHRSSAVLGFLFLAPALWFVTANVLKYELGFLPGWNILPLHPTLLLGGIAAAMVLNAASVTTFQWQRRGQSIRCQFEITLRVWNALVLALAGLSLLALLAYAVAENLTPATVAG